MQNMTQKCLTTTSMQNEARQGQQNRQYKWSSLDNRQLDTALSTDIVVLCKYTRLSSSLKLGLVDWWYCHFDQITQISLEHFYIFCPCFNFNSISFWQHLSTFEALFSSSCATSRDWVVFRMPPCTPAVCAPIHFLLQSPAPPGPLSAPVDFLSRTWARSFLIVFHLKEIKVSSHLTHSESKSGACWPERICETFPNANDNSGSV